MTNSLSESLLLIRAVTDKQLDGGERVARRKVLVESEDVVLETQD